MNTGIQRSSATPYGASTTTSPSRKLSMGQQRRRRTLPDMRPAHGIPYVATACPSYPFGLMNKVKKGVETKGTRLHPCAHRLPYGLAHTRPTGLSRIGKLATETGVFSVVRD
jgi:pyruvate ferredoxin oxidoreductase beta subunit